MSSNKIKIMLYLEIKKLKFKFTNKIKHLK